MRSFPHPLAIGGIMNNIITVVAVVLIIAVDAAV